MVVPVVQAQVKMVDQLDETQRGAVASAPPGNRDPLREEGLGHVRIFQKKGGEIPEEQQRQQRGAQEGQTRQDAAEVPQEFRALGQDFLPEELNILAVTGASGFGGGRSQGEKLWTASIGLTAWMEEDSPDIHQGDFRLVALADDRLMDYLRQRVPRDFIISAGPGSLWTAAAC